ncbi:hypothetical protein CERSUDRAFT_95877 [Gelatoporia subvermispora B]|uniref:Uncharacterized protein n=1 Tax=Ceriporiopsis subvermispora (strain B) TaxID=914234 RepID=M2QHS3_CERS8|nr:hypothetical protein CERSUDRAFT_95877 [Gelatoporia subvermispora B]
MRLTVRINYRSTRAREIGSFKNAESSAEAKFFAEEIQKDLDMLLLPPPHMKHLIYGSGIVVCHWDTAANSDLHRTIQKGFKVADKIKSFLGDSFIAWLSLGDDDPHSTDVRITVSQATKGHNKAKQLYVPKESRKRRSMQCLRSQSPLLEASASSSAAALPDPIKRSLPPVRRPSTACTDPPLDPFLEGQRKSRGGSMLDLTDAQDTLRQLSQSNAFMSLLQHTGQPIKSEPEPVDALFPAPSAPGLEPADSFEALERSVDRPQFINQYPNPIPVSVKAERAPSPITIPLDSHQDAINLDAPAPVRTKRSRWDHRNGSDDQMHDAVPLKRPRTESASSSSLAHSYSAPASRPDTNATTPEFKPPPSAPATLRPAKEPPREPAADRQRNAFTQAPAATVPMSNSPSKSHPLTRELWDIRRQITALKARENDTLRELRNVGALPSANDAGPEMPESFHFLQDEIANLRGRVQREETARRSAETALANERHRRIHAEGVLEDARRETKQPFVVPALMNAFEQLSGWSTDLLLISDAGLDY